MSATYVDLVLAVCSLDSDVAAPPAPLHGGLCRGLGTVSPVLVVWLHWLVQWGRAVFELFA